MAYHHVIAKVGQADKFRVLFSDLPLDELIECFVSPYEKGTSFFSGNDLIAPGDRGWCNQVAWVGLSANSSARAAASYVLSPNLIHGGTLEEPLILADGRIRPFAIHQPQKPLLS